MGRINFIEHKGKQILYEDFSNTKLDEYVAALDEAAAIIRAQPPHSVLALADINGITFNKEMLDRMKDFIATNTPYIKAVAVIGVQGLLSVALQTVARFAGREMHTFDSKEAAMDWLVSQ